MKVIARTGVRVPTEHHARQYITDAEAVEVPDTAYYLRRLGEGDLIVVNVAPKGNVASEAAVDAISVADVSKPNKGGK